MTCERLMSLMVRRSLRRSLTLSSSRYSTGTRMRVSSVELTRPPMTTIASGLEMSMPSPEIPSAIGTSAKIVAAAVMRIGR